MAARAAAITKAAEMTLGVSYPYCCFAAAEAASAADKAAAKTTCKIKIPYKFRMPDNPGILFFYI